MEHSLPVKNNLSDQAGTCGCGYVNCCGQCVPHEEAQRIMAEEENVVMTHCSPECSCGGIPTVLNFLKSDSQKKQQGN